ncbi:beta-glucosidase 1B [Coccomyxa sp. Obi]|nr:beta-glucosidase 1B [Coccomyxa sp. Obi]
MMSSEPPSFLPGAVADDFYHLYPIDIAAMQLLGVKHFRFSISCSRILPDGDGAINQKGLDFYAQLLDALHAAGIEPHVCLYHWDLPQALQARFGGWNSDQIVPAFAQFARIVLEALGARSKYWTTINEPCTFCFQGYGIGAEAPGIHDDVPPWNCTYNVLQAHAAAVKLFRALVPTGKIGITLNGDWGEPLTNSTADIEAAQKKNEFMVGSYADPIYLGDFPASVKDCIPFLPKITPQLAADLNGSADFFALNYYTSMYHPEEIVVTENGMDVKGEDAMTLAQALHDTARINFFRDYISEAVDAVKIDKVPMTGYFVWSLLDNYEFGAGYKNRFGVAHVDYRTQQRTFKASAMYLAGLFNTSMANVSLAYPSVA